MLIVSLNEIESRAAKAARGAGRAWGLSEEAGVAARWLAARELGWLDALLELLESAAPYGRPAIDLAGHRLVSPRGLPLDPIEAGALLSDVASRLMADPAVLTVDAVAAPLLLVPFAARVARLQEVIVSVRWRAFGICIDRAGGVLLEGPAPSTSTPCAVVIGAERGDGRRFDLPPAGGRRVDAALWHRLGVLEARTYVPASEGSRVGGAGAGLSDND